MSQRFISYTFIVQFLFLLTACAAQPKIEQIAKSHGFGRSVINSDKFRHLIYSQNVSKDQHPVLHIYLEGDGSPWLRPNIISLDPTGRTPLALDLMALDSRPSFYIGRPCYHGFYQDKNCSPELWTHARYSELVIDSMANVLQQLMQRHQTTKLYLIGYSGGGVLAMLLAERLAQIQKVITIAANLDIDAWAKQHKFSLMQNSLNPAKRLHLYKTLPQHHLAGRRDFNVQVKIIEQFVNKQDQSLVKLSVFDKFDHKCCWIDSWPSFVTGLEK